MAGLFGGARLGNQHLFASSRHGIRKGCCELRSTSGRSMINLLLMVVHVPLMVVNLLNGG